DKRVAASESWFAEFALGAHWAHVHGKFHSLLRSHWDHELPLTRPSATLSPSDGEREGVRGRFMESPLSFFACIGTMNQIGTPLPARRGEGGRRPGEGWFMERTPRTLCAPCSLEPASGPLTPSLSPLRGGRGCPKGG